MMRSKYSSCTSFKASVPVKAELTSYPSSSRLSFNASWRCSSSSTSRILFCSLAIVFTMLQKIQNPAADCLWQWWIPGDPKRSSGKDKAPALCPSPTSYFHYLTGKIFQISFLFRHRLHLPLVCNFYQCFPACRAYHNSHRLILRWIFDSVAYKIIQQQLQKRGLPSTITSSLIFVLIVLWGKRWTNSSAQCRVSSLRFTTCLLRE